MPWRGAALLLLVATASCYGMRPSSRLAGTGGDGGGHGGTSGAAGSQARAGTAGTAGATSGGSTGSLAGTGGSSDTGGASGGSGGTGGSAAVFVGGPCVSTADARALEVFARTSDGHIYRRAFDGNNWGDWNNLAALDGTVIDARSDLDCSASATSTHVVATGLNPTGSFFHAFGLGTVYNPFLREFTNATFAPGPSIADADDTHFSLGALASGATFPVLYEFGETAMPKELTPIPTEPDTLRSGPDIAIQPTGASKLTFFAGFDDKGRLSIDYHVISSGGSSWADPVKLPAPAGSFTLSPTICVESGSFGVYSVNVAAVAGGQLWFARASSIAEPFSPWTAIAAGPASSPDCAVAGESDSIVHIVVLSTAGTVLDINGKETTWVATDLGVPR